MNSKKLLIRNGAFNLINGFSAFIFALLLPKILLPYLGKTEYSLLALVVNFSAYIAFFSMGIQIAIAKFVAQTEICRNYESQKAYLNSGMIISFASIVAALIFTVIVGYLMSNSMSVLKNDAILKHNFLITILVFGSLCSLSLIYNVYAGYYSGILRNHFFSISQLSLKLISIFVIFILVTKLQIKDITLIALIIALGTLLLVPVLIVHFHFFLKSNVDNFIWFRIVSIQKVKEVLRFCFGVSIWNLAMLFVSSSSLYIVGYIDFKHVTEFSLAVVIVNIAAGIVSAVSAPLMPYFSGKFQNNSRDIKNIIIRLTIYLFVFSGFVLFFYWFFGKYIVAILFDRAVSSMVFHISFILLFGFMLRNLLLPFALFLIASKQQPLGIITAIIEATVTFTTSLILGTLFLVNGVIWGSVIGAVCGFISSLIFVLPKVKWWH